MKNNNMTEEERNLLINILRDNILFIRELSFNLLPLNINKIDMNEVHKIADEEKKMKVNKKIPYDTLVNNAHNGLVFESIKNKENYQLNNNLLYMLADSIHNIPSALANNNIDNVLGDLNVYVDMERLIKDDVFFNVTNENILLSIKRDYESNREKAINILSKHEKGE